MIKYTLYQFEKSSRFNIFIGLQLFVTFLLCIAASSIVTFNMKEYRAFSDYLDSDGLFMEINSIELNYDDGILLDSKDLEAVMKKSKVISCYSPNFIFEGKLAPYHHLQKAYDEEFIKLYKPELLCGKWLSDFSFDPEEKLIHAMITSNAYDIDVGDIIDGKTYGGYDMKIEIVGILTPDATIVGHTDGDYVNDGDYTRMFTDLETTNSHSVEVLMNQEEIKALKNILPKDALCDSSMTDMVLVKYDKDITDEEKAYNLSLMEEYGSYSYIEEMSKISELSKRKLWNRLIFLVPFAVVLFIITIISSMSSSLIMMRRQLRNIAIYNICGLSFKKCILINICTIIITAFIAAVGAVSVTYVLITNRSEFNNTFLLGANEIMITSIVFILYVFFSMIFPLVVMKKNPVSRILAKNRR